MVASSSHLCSLQSPVSSLPLCLSPPLPGVQPGTEASSGFPPPLLLPLLKRRSRQYRLHHRQCKCPQKLFASDIGDFENGIENMTESSGWCIPYRMTFPQQHGGRGGGMGGLGNKDACLFLRALAQCTFRSDPAGQNKSKIKPRTEVHQDQGLIRSFLFYFQQTCFILLPRSFPKVTHVTNTLDSIHASQMFSTRK